MPRLPSGRYVEIMSDRARHHAVRKAVRIAADSPHAHLYPVIDILVETAPCPNGGTRRMRFSGHTLGDMQWLRKWGLQDRHAFMAWIREPAQVRLIEQARRRLLADGEQPKVHEFDYADRLYSPLRSRVLAMDLARAPARQWRSTLLNLKNDGIRREELDWSGIIGFLDQIPDHVLLDKAVVADAMDFSTIRPRLINELVCDRECQLAFCDTAQKLAGYALQLAGLPVEDRDLGIVRRVSDKPYYRVGVLWPAGRALQGSDAPQWFALGPYGQAVSHNERRGQVFFSSRREAEQAAHMNALKNHRLHCGLKQSARYDHVTLHGGEAYREWLATLPEYGRTHFSGHFTEANILLHLRTKVRTTEDGKRVLFIEELQSDWHQAARRPGVRHAIAPAPFRKEWAALALKLMVLHVVEQGLDGIAWTDAAVHELRYGRAMPRLRRLYDQELPSVLNALAMPWRGEVGWGVFRTRSPWLLAVRHQDVWKVEDRAGRFSTRYRYNKEEAVALMNRHSKAVTLRLPMFVLPDGMREIIRRVGLPLFGTKTDGAGDEHDEMKDIRWHS